MIDRHRPQYSCPLASYTLGAILALFFLSTAATALAQKTEYEIKFKNLSPQLLTTAVCAAHSKKASIFKTGETASTGLARLAEDGATASFVTELESKKGVSKVVRGDFLSPGESSSITIQARPRQRISCVFGMLVVSNDAFPAAQGIRIPKRNKKAPFSRPCLRRRFRAKQRVL